VGKEPVLSVGSPIASKHGGLGETRGETKSLSGLNVERGSGPPDTVIKESRKNRVEDYRFQGIPWSLGGNWSRKTRLFKSRQQKGRQEGAGGGG